MIIQTETASTSRLSKDSPDRHPIERRSTVRRQSMHPTPQRRVRPQVQSAREQGQAHIGPISKVIHMIQTLKAQGCPRHQSQNNLKTSHSGASYDLQLISGLDQPRCEKLGANNHTPANGVTQINSRSAGRATSWLDRLFRHQPLSSCRFNPSRSNRTARTVRSPTWSVSASVASDGNSLLARAAGTIARLIVRIHSDVCLDDWPGPRCAALRLTRRLIGFTLLIGLYHLP